jgi:hypothetical protein
MTDVDELATLARLRTNVGLRLDLTGAEDRLAAEIADAARSRAGAAQPTPGRAARTPRSGQRRHRAVTGVLAAAAAVAAASALIVAPPQVRGPAGHRHASGRNTPAAGRPNSAATVHPRSARTAAELVAYSSAAAATAQRPGPRQWLYQKTVSATADARTGHELRPPLHGTTAETWWRADGRVVADRYDRRLHYQSMRGSTISDWPSTGLAYLSSLPTTPPQLEAVITANITRTIRRYGRAGALAGLTRHEAVVANIQGLLEDVPVLPAALRAGLYGVLAHLPYVHFDTSATDMTGRHGVAFWTAGHGLETQIVINPRTYAFMGVDTIAVKSFTQVATDGTYHFKKGGLYDATAVLQTGVVDHAGQHPRNAR